MAGGEETNDQVEEESVVKHKDCYKVLTCDVNDDIVIFQGSLMVGVARQAALAQQRKNQHYKNQPLGILDDKEAQLFINLLDRLQDTEARLFEYVKVRVEHE